MPLYRILFLGDVVGKPGRQAVREGLPSLIQIHEPLFTIVNGENSAGGVGITPDIAEEIFKQVLARDAETEAALAGLEAIGRQRAQKLTAAELIAGDETPEVRGLTARKIQLLSRYLGKLRPRTRAS